MPLSSEPPIRHGYWDALVFENPRAVPERRMGRRLSRVCNIDGFIKLGFVRPGN
jgi:hypothetical protein